MLSIKYSCVEFSVPLTVYTGCFCLRKGALPYFVRWVVVLYFWLAFRGYKWGADDGDDSIINGFGDYSIFIDWFRLTEYILKIVCCFFSIGFAVRIKLLRLIVDLLVVRSRFLFTVWWIVVLHNRLFTFCPIGENPLLVRFLLDFIQIYLAIISYSSTNPLQTWWFSKRIMLERYW